MPYTYITTLKHLFVKSLMLKDLPHKKCSAKVETDPND